MTSGQIERIATAALGKHEAFLAIVATAFLQPPEEVRMHDATSTPLERAEEVVACEDKLHRQHEFNRTEPSHQTNVLKHSAYIL